MFLRIFLLSLDLQCKIWLCKNQLRSTNHKSNSKGCWLKVIFLPSLRSPGLLLRSVCVCVLVKVFGGNGAAGCWDVCVRVFSAAVRSSECQMVLVKLKSSPTLDWSSAVWTTCCLEWPASIQTGRILQHPKLPAASVFSQVLSASLSSAACRQKLPVNEGYRSSARTN